MPAHRHLRTGAVTLALLGAGFAPAHAADRDLSAAAPPPPVNVTLRSDATTLRVGDRTTLHAMAQVSPDFRARAERVFTWNLDLLGLTPELADLVPATLVRPASDLDPVLGSVGTLDGSNLLGIRDSFLNREGAGVAAPVELFSVQIQAIAPGSVSFRLRAGSIGTDDSPDFLVLPLGDEDPWSGGNYSGAAVTLTVSSNATVPPVVRIERLPDGRVRVEAESVSGGAVTLEESENPADPASWRKLAQSPAGSATVIHEATPAAGARFYRAAQ